MRLPALAVLGLLCAACAASTPQDAGDRSWDRALRAARRAAWPYARIGAMRERLDRVPEAGARRDLGDILYDLAEARVPPEDALRILDAAAAALAAGAPGDPLAAALQIGARAGYPAEALIQTAALVAEAPGRGVAPPDLVRMMDRAAVFGTPPWTVLQFLKDLLASADRVPAGPQADLFEEALGRKGRPLEAQLVLQAYREAVLGGLPPVEMASACRRKIRRGMAPAAMPAWLTEVARWPVPPLAREDGLRLVGIGLAYGLPDDEVAGLGGFVARGAMDARDAKVLAARLEDHIRRGLRGKELLATALEGFSGARPAAPSPR